jgi:hypothetical protein
VENEHLHHAELAEPEKQTTRHAAPKAADATLEHLRQIQHGLGNRALGQLIQAKYDDGGKGENGALEVADAPFASHLSHPASASAVGNGRPLGEGERALFGSRFKEDFDGVRVHTGAAAAESARSIGARAYAVGQNLVFAEGQYAPHTEGGVRLLAHELAHVVQQRRPGAGGASAESGADAAAEAVSSGRDVSSQAIGSAAPGLYADNGFALSPAPAFGKPSYGFKVPPLKLSRKFLLFLLDNDLMTAEMREMILRGEVGVEDDETTRMREGREARQPRLFPPSEVDDILRRVERKRAAEEEAKARATEGPAPGPTVAVPKPYNPPDDKPKLAEWKGLTDGIDFNVPLPFKLPRPLAGMAHPNLSFSGLTVPAVKVGQFDSKLVAGFDKSLEVQLSYRDWHLTGNVDLDGKWVMKLSYPNDTPIPAGGTIESMFTQGETAMREAIKTVGAADLNKFTELKDKASTLAGPIKTAVDAGKGIKNLDQRRVNVSFAFGSGPAPGRLPPSALKGMPQPKGGVALYGGLNLNFWF